MSTDPTQPAHPAQRPQGPPDQQAPPTVQVPVQPAAAPRGPEPRPTDATQPVRQWQAPPPPPPPPATRQDQSQAPAARMPQPPPARYAAPEPTVQDSAPAGWQQRPQPQDEATRQWTPQQGNQDQWTPPQGANQGQWPAQPLAQPPTRGRGPRRRGPKRRVRRSVMALFTVIVLLILLVIGDRVALAITDNAFADQFKSQGLPVKPSVSIKGFPFLTQLAAKDFNEVDISASNIPVALPDNGGTLSITSANATVKGLHISGYSSSANAKVDQINATVFISFGALAAAGSLGGTGVTLTQAGPNTVKITAGIAGLSDTEQAQITQTGPQTISIKLLDSGGLGGVLGAIGFNSFSFTLPKVVPASLKITGLSLNSQGLTVSAAATDATFSQ